MRTQLLLIVVSICLAIPCSAAGAAQEDVQEFASRIAAISGTGAASPAIKNSSSVSAEQFNAFRQALQKAPRSDGVRLKTTPQATTEIRVTLSENVRGMVYLAEVQQGSETRVTMAEASGDGSSCGGTDGSSAFVASTA